MKKVLLFAAMAAFVMAQDVKVAGAPAVPAAQSERTLTKAEIMEYQLAALRIEKLKTDFKIAEFNEKVQPLSSDQQAWYAAMCKSIGLTDDQIKANECGVNVGVDLDGKPIMGQNGKPVQSRVWHINPVDPPKAADKK